VLIRRNIIVSYLRHDYPFATAFVNRSYRTADSETP